MFFDSFVHWAEICVEHVRLQTLLWWLGRRGADQVDLIICLAIWTLYKHRVPLLSDDFRAIPIASRNELRSASLFGSIVEVLGGQHGRKNRRSGLIFAMLFLNAFLYRFRLDFLRLRTLKIELSPRREHNFCKIDVFQTSSKIHRFWLHFRSPNPREFD